MQLETYSLSKNITAIMHDPLTQKKQTFIATYDSIQQNPQTHQPKIHKNSKY